MEIKNNTDYQIDAIENKENLNTAEKLAIKLFNEKLKQNPSINEDGNDDKNLIFDEITQTDGTIGKLLFPVVGYEKAPINAVMNNTLVTKYLSKILAGPDKNNSIVTDNEISIVKDGFDTTINIKPPYTLNKINKAIRYKDIKVITDNYIKIGETYYITPKGNPAKTPKIKLVEQVDKPENEKQIEEGLNSMLDGNKNWFDLGKGSLSENFKESIKGYLGQINKLLESGKTLELTGLFDKTGTNPNPIENGKTLSLRRADAVKKYLSEQFPTYASQVIVKDSNEPSKRGVDFSFS